MFGSFEIKSYPQLNFALGAVNVILLLACFAGVYYLVLIPEHVDHIDKLRPFAAQASNAISIAGISCLSCLWGWIATHFLRLHDRVHEPHIRKWRASYDADFILRSLLSDFAGGISQDIFVRAYHDKRTCRTLMERLFYKFVGDETETAAGKRMFFYTAMWKYWSLALLDLHASATLVFIGIYHLVTSSHPKAVLLFIAVTAILVSRIMSNWLLDEAHEITEEQIVAIKTNHAAALHREATSIATDLGM